MIGSKFIERVNQLELKHYVTIVVVTIVFVGALYGIYNYRQGQIEPVEIQIISPISGMGVYEQETIIVEGRTRKNTYVMVGDVETRSNKEGNFDAEVPLKVGENKITVISGEGKEESIATVIVFREEAEPVSYPTTVTVDTRPKSDNDLNNSGPETLFIPEALLLSGSALLYGSSRKRFKKVSN